MSSPSTSSSEGYGGFVLAGMQLALPMTAMREVVPRGVLIDLPCPASCVIGGIDLRGVVVPVVDLRIVLGRPSPLASYPCVIIMVHEARILGLLADGVTGIFNAQSDGLHRVSVSDPVAAVFEGSLLRKDDNALVSVLSTRALASLPQVPLVDDPEPARQMTEQDGEEVIINDESLPLMLARCGRLPLAVDAMAVHATLSQPVVEPSVLAMGHCRGVLTHGGAKVPAVDLQSLCGLGKLDLSQSFHAFVVLLPEGLVAFLVSEVVDVVRAMPHERIRVPTFALPHPTLFCGALPVSALPDELAERTGMAEGQYLLLDAQALKTADEVVALARANTPADGLGGDAQSFVNGMTQVGQGRRAMLTYALAGETATPLDQVSEILAYARNVSIFESDGPLLGFMVNRGRSIPVLCLSRLSGGPPPEVTPAASVLVVESDGELIGFAVPQLKSIEPADWEPELPTMGGHGGHAWMGQAKSRKLALVGTGQAERMLPVLDLQDMARQAQASCVVAAH
jgi:purine-binding chemotaxis protein CheW